MSDQKQIELDRMLNAMARDERRVWPMPSDGLVELVLADAADVTAASAADIRAKARVAARRHWLSFATWRPFIRRAGWPSGALATMILGLILGLSLGYGYSDEAVALSQIGEYRFSSVADGIFSSEGPF
ncbi:MAG: hypothetical protein AAF415_18725 [Pseudomonadota bacterium]